MGGGTGGRRQRTTIVSVVVGLLLLLPALVVREAEGRAVDRGDRAVHREAPRFVLRAGDTSIGTDVVPDEPTGRGSAGMAFRVELDASAPPDWADAIDRAAGRWAAHLRSSVPVDIWVEGADLPDDILATGGAALLWANSPGVLRTDTWIPDALANARAGRQLEPDLPDVVLVFDTSTAWSTSPVRPGPGTFDLESAALREIGVALGFGTSLAEDDEGVVRWGFEEGWPLAGDRLLEAADGTPMLDAVAHPNGSAALRALYVGDLYADGPTITHLAGGPVRMATADPPDPLVSGTYFDEDAHPPGSPDSALTPTLAPAEVTRVVGPGALGYLTDIGWPSNVPASAPAAPTEVTASPGALGAEVRWTLAPGTATVTVSEVQVGVDGPITRSTEAAPVAWVDGLSRTDAVSFRVRVRTTAGWSEWSALSPPVVASGLVGPAPDEVRRVDDAGPFALDADGRLLHVEVTDEGLLVSATGVDGVLDWTAPIIGEVLDGPVDVVSGPDGEVVVAVPYSGRLEMGSLVLDTGASGLSGLAVVRYAGDGSIEWASDVVTPHDRTTSAWSLAAAADAVWVGGTTTSDAPLGDAPGAAAPAGGPAVDDAPFVATLDPTTGSVRHHLVGTVPGSVSDISAAPGGGAWIVVTQEGPADFGAVLVDGSAALRLDGDLDTVGHRYATGVEDLHARSDGSLVVVGRLTGDEPIRWVGSPPVEFAAPDGPASWVALVAPDGSPQWIRIIDGPWWGTVADAGGGDEIVLAGGTTGPVRFGRPDAPGALLGGDAEGDALAMRLSPDDGRPTWVVAGGGAGADGVSPAFVRAGHLFGVLSVAPPAAFGAGAPVEVSDATTLARWTLGPPAGPPPTPSGVVVVRGDTRATVSWIEGAADPGWPTGGHVVTASTGGRWIAGPGQASITATGLTNGTPVVFTVFAIAAVGESPPSAPSAPVTPAALPDAPRSARVRAVPGGVAVSWSADEGAVLPTAHVVSVDEGPEVVAPAGDSSVVVTGLTDGVPVGLEVWARNEVGDGPRVQLGPVSPGLVTGAGYHPVAPTRLLDTRMFGEALGPGGSRRLPLPATPGISAASALVLNVTAVAPSARTHLTLWPAGGPRPTASNLNTEPGRTIANLVTVATGDGGTVDLYNSSGSTHVVVDLMGFYDGDGTGARFVPLTPTRVLDSRKGRGTLGSPFGPAVTRTLDVTDTFGSGVPAHGVEAVVLNVTAVGAREATHLTVWASGRSRPGASNLNLDAGITLPNLVIAEVGDDGAVQIRNNSGVVDVVADVVGYFSSSGDPLHAVMPARLLDTRNGTGGPLGAVGPKGVRVLDVTGVSGVPASGVTAVVLNVTAVDASEATHITVWPSDRPRPGASNLNAAAGWTVANLVTVKVAPDGTVSLFNNSGQVHLVADVVGWYG